MFIRKVYERMIMMIFNRRDRDDVVNMVLDEITSMCNHTYATDMFIATKSIGDVGDRTVEPFVDEDGKKKGMLGSYKVPLLPSDPVARAHKFALKDATTEAEYYMRCLPATVQLAERMRWRGKRVDQGSRVEYVISTMGGHKANMFIKVEDAEYFGRHASSLRLDYMSYLSLMINPFDDVLNTMYDRSMDGIGYAVNEEAKPYTRDVVKTQYKHRLRVRGKMLEQIVSIFSPQVLIE